MGGGWIGGARRAFGDACLFGRCVGGVLEAYGSRAVGTRRCSGARGRHSGGTRELREEYDDVFGGARRRAEMLGRRGGCAGARGVSR